jgi:HNH endonuclease
MKRKLPNAVHVWKQLDDFVVPNLRLNVVDRAVYSHLLRHTRLECRHRLCFSQMWLAKGIGTCRNTARTSLRRLVDRGAVRLIENSYGGHVVEVLLPEEIRAAFTASPQHPSLSRSPKASPGSRAAAPALDELDFFAAQSLREAIYVRERHSCFYCLRRLKKTTRCLDHVIARMHSGGNSYRNLVACCMECNSRKAQRPAADFLCSLFHERRLTTRLLASRLRALEALAAGNLRPRLPDKQGDRRNVSGFPRCTMR